MFERLKNWLKPVKCRFCGKVLTSKASRERGAGPECAREHRATMEREYLEKRGQEKLFGEVEDFGAKPPTGLEEPKN